MLAALPSTPDQKGNGVVNVINRIKLSLKRFDEDEQGMNTVEAVILLFVAAIVLLVFFTLIWPLIRDRVYAALESLFSQTGISS